MPTSVQIIGVPGIPLIETGDDLATLIARAVEESGERLQDGDVVVVTSKIVSKAEGRWVDLATVEPDEEARRFRIFFLKDLRFASSAD